MMERTITPESIAQFEQHLVAEELADGTIQKYKRDLLAFSAWAGNTELTRELAAGWKEQLVLRGYAPATINSMLAVINHFFKFTGRCDCTVKFLKLQRRLFRDRSRELAEEEFRRLVDTADRTGQKRLALLLETIAATGIRVSEVRYITVEAARLGRAEIALKGKIRTILLPSRLCRKLLKYAGKNNTAPARSFAPEAAGA